MFQFRRIGQLTLKIARCTLVGFAASIGVSYGANNYIWLHTDDGVNQLSYHYTDQDTEPSPTSSGWVISSMSSLDSLLNTHIQNHWSDGGAYIRFQSGTFWTYGIGRGGGNTIESYPAHGYTTIVSGSATYPRIDIKGKGMTQTTLKLRNSAPVNWGQDGINGFNWVIFPEGWVKDFYLGYLQLDCNWSGQAQPVWPGSPCAGPNASKIDPTYTCSYKNGGVAATFVAGTVEFIKVFNFGANSMCSQEAFGSCQCNELPGGGTEAFPLSVSTANINNGYANNSNVDTPVKVLNCQVTQFRKVKQGYCTGIIVSSPTDVPPQDVRTLRLAKVEGNNVFRSLSDPNDNINHGIAYGTARTERVDFINNNADDTNAGFNSDTGPVYNVKLIGNHFNNVNVGANFGAMNAPANYFRNYRFENNLFYLKGRYYNSYLTAQWLNCNPALYCLYPISEWEPCFGVRISGGTTGTVVWGNTFTPWPASSFSGPSGTYPNGKWYYCVWKPDCINDPSPSLYSNTPGMPQTYNYVNYPQ